MWNRLGILSVCLDKLSINCDQMDIEILVVIDSRCNRDIEITQLKTSDYS